MKIRLHRAADEFREIAEPLYRRDPVGNTIELALLRSDRLGDDVLLFADLANPISNGIYQAIGFEAVTDSVRVEFSTGR